MKSYEFCTDFVFATSREVGGSVKRVNLHHMLTDFDKIDTILLNFNSSFH